MRWSGGETASLFQVIRERREVDALLPQGPIIVHSKRAGGGIRLLYIQVVIGYIFGIRGGRECEGKKPSLGE